MAHLRKDETNPFTRESLTIEEFNQYNLKEEILNKVNDFKQKYKTYLNEKAKK